MPVARARFSDAQVSDSLASLVIPFSVFPQLPSAFQPGGYRCAAQLSVSPPCLTPPGGGSPFVTSSVS